MLLLSLSNDVLATKLIEQPDNFVDVLNRVSHLAFMPSSEFATDFSLQLKNVSPNNLQRMQTLFGLMTDLTNDAGKQAKHNYQSGDQNG